MDTEETDDRLIDERKQEQAAAAEAGAIGGPTPVGSDADPAERAVQEGGGGESEGFEDAEAALIEHASHGDPGPDPTHMAGQPEGPGGAGAIYGEADHEESSDDTDDAARADDED